MNLKRQQNKSIKQACGDMQELQPKDTAHTIGLQHICMTIASDTLSYRTDIKQWSESVLLYLLSHLNKLYYIISYLN